MADERAGVNDALEEARAVDDSRNRGAAGAITHLRPHSDSWLAAVYLVGIAGWLLATRPSGVSVVVFVACVVAHTAAASIEVEIGPGSVVPTAPVLVACLFLVPAPVVPLVAICGSIGSAIVGRVRDRDRRDRFAVLIGSAIHAVGPAVVFAVAGARAPRLADWPVYVVAAGAQFALDAASSWFLNCFRLGVPAAKLRAALGFAYFVDLLLLPVGYVIAFVAPRSAAGLVLFVPLLLLLVLMNRDRTRQLDRAIALATRDALTGLPNRTLFVERLDEQLSGDRAFAVLLVDLDHFKEVNDTLGHALGDELLVEIGRRLQQSLTAPDLVARLGGDEFALLVQASGDAAALERVDEVVAIIRRPLHIAGFDLDIDASVGIALVDDPVLTAADLLRRADVAMYTAKADRSGRAFYSPARDGNSAERLELAGRLRRAIADGELSLYYQPKVALATRTVIGFEALIRWDCPGRGMVPPDAFVPIAERTELIRPLTAFVFASAIAQAAQWRRLGHDLQVSVNLSARNLGEDDLVESIFALLDEHELTPGALAVELTETTVMMNPERAREVMGRLRARGIKISIDDFGTGYSSLAYLTALPNDELKVDRSFVQAMTSDPNAETVVRAVVDLAHSLRLAVVAEGIETEAEAATLQRLGCAVGQGYLFSRPLPAADALAWIDAFDRAQRRPALISRRVS